MIKKLCIILLLLSGCGGVTNMYNVGDQAVMKLSGDCVMVVATWPVALWRYSVRDKLLKITLVREFEIREPKVGECEEG